MMIYANGGFGPQVSSELQLTACPHLHDADDPEIVTTQY